MLKQLTHKEPQTCLLQDIEFRIVYSKRRTLGISILPDATVIVRAPYRATLKTISRIVQEKSAWIIRHRDNYRGKVNKKLNSHMTDGEKQLFRGNECLLKISFSKKPFVSFSDNLIEIGTDDTEDKESVRRLLYKGYRAEAARIFPEMLAVALKTHESRMFRPLGLVIRSMKSRWGSCSGKGIITLSTELIKLPDIFIEYVIIHELCHLQHHNHGKDYYNLLSELFPEWKQVRKDLREFIH
jgi:predicted metal-dependent hydrolase